MLVDKPVAKNADDARRAFRAARAAGVTATVGLGKRALGAWQDAKAMIDRGRLGRLLAAESTFTTSQVKVRDPRNHLFSVERSGHGILHWLGVHDVDALLWLAGEPIVEVQAMTANVGRQEIGVEDAVSVAFRYASPAPSARSISSTRSRARAARATCASRASAARSRSPATAR